MKTEAILFLLSIHEGNELRDQLPSSAYDDLAAAGLLDGANITEKGYAYVRLLCDVPEPVQTWADPRSFIAGNEVNWGIKAESVGEIWDAFTEYQKRQKDARLLDRGVKVDIVLKDTHATPSVASGEPFSKAVEIKAGGITMTEDSVPAGYQPNPGQIPGGVDRAADIQIVRANGKRKTLPAQAINWGDLKTQDRVVGWRYAAAAGEARIHTPGETMPAPDA